MMKLLLRCRELLINREDISRTQYHVPLKMATFSQAYCVQVAHQEDLGICQMHAFYSQKKKKNSLYLNVSQSNSHFEPF